ncbi:hypothetical protein TKK_0004271 [Trichogramma kaykai]
MAEDLPDEDNPVYLQYLRLRKRLRHYAGRTDEEDYPRITRWLPGDEDRNSFLVGGAWSPSSPPAGTLPPAPYQGSALHLAPVRHCAHMIGASAPANFAAARDWNIPRVPYLLPGPMALQSPHHPPRAGNPLCLLSLLDVVPAEWGIVDSEATCSFSRELLLQGEQVWLAHRGTDKYRMRKMSEEECFTYIDYGSLASNCIAQIVTDAVPGEPQLTWLAIQPDRQ